MFAVLGRQTLGCVPHRALGGVVPHESRSGPRSANGSNVDHRSGLVYSEERWYEGADTVEDGLDVDAEHAVELIVRDLEGRLVAVRGARVVDEDIHGTVFLGHSLKQRLPVSLGGYVGMVEADVGVRGSYSLAALVVDVGDDNLGALFRETACDAFTVARTTTWNCQSIS